MRVLVTGGRGLIGSAVVRRLRAAEFDVVAPHSDDLRVPAAARRILRSAEPDAVVHCAARLGGVGWQQTNPAGPITDSLVMAAHVFEAAAEARAHLVFFSSSTVYPTPSEVYPASEGWTPEPEPQYRGVAGMKVYLESLLDYYVDVFRGFRATVLRPTAVYGPNDRGFAADGTGHVVPDLIRRAASGELPLTVWGSPKVVRDFVYADDVADAVLKSLNLPKDAQSDLFNVGSGTKTTIGDLADAVLLAVHGPHKLVELEDRCSGGLVRFDPSKPTAVKWRQVLIGKARDMLGWEPKVDLAEGLKRTVAWFRKQQVTK